MTDIKLPKLKINKFEVLSYVTLFIFMVFPLLFKLSYRVHLDLPYEGTYRMYIGQMPFKDFKMPLGYGLFLVPLICFHIFGPFLKSLLISQMLITLLGGISLISVLKRLKLNDVQVYISLFVFCISYTVLYFWPWYNNTAFTFQLMGLALLLKTFDSKNWFSKIGLLSISALLVFLAFFTKQDYGGLAFVFSLLLILYMSILKKDYITPISFVAIFGIIASAFIYPLLPYDFQYWFNLGKPPHQNRLNLAYILEEILLHCQWEKFYLLAICIIMIPYTKDLKAFFINENKMLLFLISVGFIFEAMIAKCTSHLSFHNTTFYHAFGVAFILANVKFDFDLRKNKYFVPVMILILFWWSGMIWEHAHKFFKMPELELTTKNSRAEIPPGRYEKWSTSEFKTLSGVKIPVSAINSIRKMKAMKITEKNPNAKILNMSELTILPYELGYTPLTDVPLWYHVDVGIFQKQVDELCAKIAAKEYDMVLFEEIPYIDDFFPEKARKALQASYKLDHTFLAPRLGGESFVEVYLP